MAVGGDIGGAVGDLIGGIIADLLARGDYEAAERLARQAAQQYGTTPLPTERAVLGPSAAEGVRPDTQAREARRAALRRLMEVGLEGGLDIESQAAIADAQQRAAQASTAQAQALLRQAQERGMPGSNMSIASQLLAQQAGADRAAQVGMQAAADARRRALAALASSGDLAAGLERDDLGLQLGLADRRDAIAEFNARNAQQFAQQQFANQLELEDRRRRGLLDESDIYAQRARRTVEKGRGYGRAGGTILGTGAQTAFGGFY